MLKFENYIADFSNSVNILDFVICLIVATILSLIIKSFYIRFGKSFSNRERFASIFVPMALSTLLIITVVQASIALSLGLVGALSIVRFRAAIKEPEELTYIFLVIGVGLTCGANKPLLAVVAIAFILPLVYLNTKSGRKDIYTKNRMLITVRSKVLNVSEITTLLASGYKHLELKRLEENDNGVFASFLSNTDKIDNVSAVNSKIKEADSMAVINIIDQPEMVL